MNLLTLKDLDPFGINHLIDWALKIKTNPKKYNDILEGKTLTMIFEKPSTRTRCSFEAGMAQLGGHSIFLDWKVTHLEKAALKDEIKSIERYSDIIMARVHKHNTLVEMANSASIPIINGLSEKYHPCQILGDLQTIKEKKGEFEGLTVAYIGDGNNVCNSLIIGCSKMGIHINVATPKGYEPSQEAVKIGGINVNLGDDPKVASNDVDIVYTDTWISMGFEEEREKRMRDFKGFTVTKEILGDALFMHCLPAYRGVEVTDEVMDSPQSIIFDQAENRLHIQKAIILWLMKMLPEMQR
ncbi:ornithine carbamoyltransferase [[Eubacterium] cellulosolvens]